MIQNLSSQQHANLTSSLHGGHSFNFLLTPPLLVLALHLSECSFFIISELLNLAFIEDTVSISFLTNNLQYGSVVNWDEQLTHQESDVPSILDGRLCRPDSEERPLVSNFSTMAIVKLCCHNFTQIANFVIFFVSSISYRPTDLSLLKEFSKNVTF